MSTYLSYAAAKSQPLEELMEAEGHEERPDCGGLTGGAQRDPYDHRVNHDPQL